MAQSAPTQTHGYWLPANANVARLANPAPLEDACLRCGMDYPIGARFCHVCGASRDPRAALESPSAARSAQSWNNTSARKRLGLSSACFLFFLIGIGCMLGCALTGIFYKAGTFVDWQAVQSWRIQWLLAAMAALLSGILLKSKEY
jgi:hypothetical protein